MLQLKIYRGLRFGYVARGWERENKQCSDKLFKNL